MGLVAFLFGITERGELPGGVLVEMLGEFGLRPAAVRQLLTRMRAHGQIAGRRVGRRTHYRLIGPVAEQVGRLRAERGEGPAWDGSFRALLHQVPERDRAFRDRLRRLAVFYGYASLQPGVLIGVVDRADELVAALGPVPSGATVRAARLALPDEEAAAVASVAWDLPALAADLRAHVVGLRSALAEPGAPPAAAATVRRLAEVSNQTLVDLIRDPVLPAALRPADWPGEELRVALGELAERWLPPALAYLDERIAAHGGCDGGCDAVDREGRGEVVR